MTGKPSLEVAWKHHKRASSSDWVLSRQHREGCHEVLRCYPCNRQLFKPCMVHACPYLPELCSACGRVPTTKPMMNS